MNQLRTLRTATRRRADFVVVLTPWESLVRPVTDAARQWAEHAYPAAPKALQATLIARTAHDLNQMVEALSAAGFSLEVL
jgi:heme-degrading monooxygenase HmoA